MKALNRRTLLRGAGGIAMALPFLDAMSRPRRARAAGVAKRLVVFFSGNGTAANSWNPTGGETDFQLSDILSPLQPHRDQLTLITGINNQVSYTGAGNNPHDLSMGTMLTASKLRLGPSGYGRAGHIVDGTPTGASMDQELARRIGVNSRFSSLTLGVQSTSSILEPMVLKMSYRGPSDPVIPEDDPGKAFATMFGDNAASQAQVRAVQKRRGTVLDAVLTDYTGLMAQLGANDRAKLDRHTTSLRDLEKQITMAGPTTACHGLTPTAPTVTLTRRPCLQDGRPATCVGDFPTIGAAQMQIAALALACDLTRVVGLQWSTAESPVVHTWAGVNEEHHLMSHDAGKAAMMAKIDRWYAGQLKTFLDTLAGVTDGDGTTLLDGSIVMWVNELSNGTTHDRRNLRYVLAGKGNGALRGGRFLTFNGQPHNQLLAGVMNLFGANVSGFGDPAFPGTLAGLG